MDVDRPDIDTWFAAHGLRLEVHEVDVTGMERLREGPEPARYSLTLTGKEGHRFRPAYAEADALADAKSRARDRYEQELAEAPSTALRWDTPRLTMTAGDGSFEPAVELHNSTDQPTTVKGPMMATGRLLHPDGSPVTSHQQQPWPMPAVLRVHQLPPRGSTRIPVALSLLSDEKATLPPGRYRLSEVWYGELQAPDTDLEIVAA